MHASQENGLGEDLRNSCFRTHTPYMARRKMVFAGEDDDVPSCPHFWLPISRSKESNFFKYLGNSFYVQRGIQKFQLVEEPRMNKKDPPLHGS